MKYTCLGYYDEGKFDGMTERGATRDVRYML